MEILIILLLFILLFINVFALYKQFYEHEKPVAGQIKPKLTKEEKDKQEQIKKSFENLMNYDESIARKIRK